MPRKLRKSVSRYLSKIKSANSTLHLSSSKSWILRGCKHVKTLSFSAGAFHKDDGGNSNSNSDDRNKNLAAATLDDVDRFLFENFRSLYIRDSDDDEGGEDDNDGGESKKKNLEEAEISHDHLRRRRVVVNSFCDESPGSVDPPVKRSNRLLTRPVGSSSSDETATDDVAGSTVSNALTSESGGNNGVTAAVIPEECIAVLTYTRAPQEEFGRSMEEMAAARMEEKGSVDWEFMEELLFAYLNLNEKKSHKFILSAFADLVVGLRPAAAGEGGPARARAVL